MSDDSQSRYSHDELVEDVWTLAETLRDTHPDPYTGHGGRVQFHRRLEELTQSIPKDGESIERFHRRVQRFAARTQDGHTKVVAPDTFDKDVDGRFPFGFRVVGTALYIDTVYDETDTDVLGGRLVAVEDIPVADLWERQATLESADNVYGDLVGLASTLEGESIDIENLLDTSTRTPTLTIEMPAGRTEEQTIEPIEAYEPVETLDTAIGLPETSGEPAYRFLDDDRSTALLVLPDCHSHREVHEIAAFIGGDVEDHYGTRDAYRRLVGEPVPENSNDVLAGLPAATKILTNLVEEMADAGTETLVVDTRDNNGGSSLIAKLLVYILHGYDGVAETVSDSFSISKVSELYREQRSDSGSINETANATGFDFSSYFEDIEDGREELTELTEMSPTFAAEVESGEFAGYYCPETTVVVTSAETFSAGVEPGILLSKLGAAVVGVPSMQAPNGPRDILFDELPNTGLEVRISYRHHEFLPDESGDAFEPDIELTPARFEAFDRSADAGVRLALAYANDDVLGNEAD
jgi:hypothetical protein